MPVSAGGGTAVAEGRRVASASRAESAMSEDFFPVSSQSHHKIYTSAPFIEQYLIGERINPDDNTPTLSWVARSH